MECALHWEERADLSAGEALASSYEVGAHGFIRGRCFSVALNAAKKSLGLTAGSVSLSLYEERRSVLQSHAGCFEPFNHFFHALRLPPATVVRRPCSLATEFCVSCNRQPFSSLPTLVCC